MNRNTLETDIQNFNNNKLYKSIIIGKTYIDVATFPTILSGNGKVVYYGKGDGNNDRNEQTIQNLLDRLAKSQKQKHKTKTSVQRNKSKSKRNKKIKIQTQIKNQNPNAQQKIQVQADSLNATIIKSNLTITYSV
jgi:hypothetical protein